MGMTTSLSTSMNTSSGAAGRGGGRVMSVTATTTPTTNMSALGLGLHMGMGTGRGVGLGAGLPVTPFGHGHGRGFGGLVVVEMGRGVDGDFFVEGDEEDDADVGEQGEEGQSLTRSSSGVLVGGSGDEDTRGVDRHDDDDDGNDDADDEDEGSHTRVGEGSSGYKEFVGFQGYDSPRREEGRFGYDGTHEYDEDIRDDRAHEYEEDLHDVGPHEYEEPHEYDEKMQGEGGDLGHDDEDGMQQDENDGRQREGGAYGYDDRQYEEEMEYESEGGDLQREEYFPPQPESSHGYESGLQGEDHNGDSLAYGATLRPGAKTLCGASWRGMEADVIDVLNAKVDEMEDLLVLAEETAEAEATAERTEEQGDAEAEVELENRTQPKAASNVEADKELEEAGTEAESAAQEEQAGLENREAGKSPSGRSPALFSVPLLQIGDQDIRDLASPLPWLNSTFRYSELSISPTHSNPELAAATNEALEAAKQAAQAQWDMAERIAREAEKLNLELAAVVQKLQSRKEESDHLHALLVDRAESAATRILDLEKEIVDLEDDILANESELRHLRLKIRAVETLCYEFVRPDADPDLFQAIENWKADWVLVRDRMSERKKDRKERRVRLHRAGCVISSLEQREEESTLTSLAGLSMSVSMLGLGGARKGY
ncbi:hypothetical protein NEMBOFW57_004420 [Staphylotrichum longicolle]|uniref:Uncharacterized protein n=1 Tax=Staphylotrichum longicolle TaxID=669026 RepID=A0AAD4I0G1_9PEZI|nr:hypothetical protein NEMBOFW57_004420 [Staphylotrichum longicolle]